MSRRIVICGGRTFTDYAFLCQEMDRITAKITQDIVVVSGGAPGVDTLGAAWARSLGHKVETYPADWDRLGRSAGPIRNQQMVDSLLEGDAVVAFWDGVSRGTGHTVRMGRERTDIHTIVVRI